MHARLRSALAASAIVIAAAGRAHAAGGVIVVTPARAASVAADVGNAVARAAGADADAVARARRARAAGAVPAEQLAGFARVARLETEGWRAYLQAVDAEFAASRLANARAAAEALLVLDGGAEVYAGVSVRLGMVLVKLGRGDDAAAAFRLAHALDPSRPVTTAEFLPDGVAAYEAAIAGSPPRRQVAIVAPAGTAIAIDGSDAGRAPLTAELAIGEHVIVARAVGREPRGLAVSIDAATERVEVALDVAGGGALADDRALAAGADEARAGAAVADTLEYAELDEVFVVASVYRGGGPALVGQRCVAARPACTAMVEIGHPDGGLDAAARLLVERLRAAEPRYGVVLPADPRVASGERRVGGGGCRLCRNKWVWIGGGATVAAVITTVVLAVTAPSPPPIVTVDPGDFTQ